MNLHILSVLVTDFWKCPKKGFKQKWVLAFLEQNVSSTFCHQTSSTCHTDTTQSVIWSDPSPDTILLSCYCTVLYCNVLYCIILYSTVLYLGAQRAPKSHPEELEVGGRRPPYLLVLHISDNPPLSEDGAPGTCLPGSLTNERSTEQMWELGISSRNISPHISELPGSNNSLYNQSTINVLLSVKKNIKSMKTFFCCHRFFNFYDWLAEIELNYLFLDENKEGTTKLLSCSAGQVVKIPALA